MNNFYSPLFPSSHDQGDPYVLSLPKDVAKFRYYVYTTGENVSTGKAFPMYASNDLITWKKLGESLVSNGKQAHWAPCVMYIKNLEYPFVMLYSKGKGLEEQGHIGHRIRRAHSKSPEGPFVDSGHILTPGRDDDQAFNIDADIYRLPDGKLRMAWATDFINDAPIGTGIVEAEISDDLTHLLSSPQVLARATADWQVYEKARVMPWKKIPGIDWRKGMTVKWHTVEAPVGGIISPTRKKVYLYSGGPFYGKYAVSAFVEGNDGELFDISKEGHFVISSEQIKNLFAPGHPSLVEKDGQQYLMLHGRFGSIHNPRQMFLAPLRWNEKGWPYCGL